jgi:DNA polymerase-3 subunit epsilon
MKLHLKRPIVFFDVETTGLDTKEDRIIELAVIKLFPDGQSEEKCRRFNPLMPIPKEATGIHGITDEDVKNEPPFSRSARPIAAFFAGCDLAGFNIIKYDVPILQAELMRADAKLDLADISLIDAYEIFITREPRSLEAAVAFYCGRKHQDAHTALGDVRAAADVLAAQLERYPDLAQSPSELDKQLRHPESVDRGGKLRWVDGKVTVAFGRNRGRTIEFLAREEPEYLRWMIDNEVVPDAAHLLRDALIVHFTPPRDEPDAP